MVTTNFIKKIKEDDIDERVHARFTRYSKGEFKKEPFEIKTRAGDILVYSGFEYMNFLHWFLAEHTKSPVEIKGPIATVEELDEELDEMGLEYDTKGRRGKKGDKYVIKKQEITAEKYRELVDKFFDHYMIFKAESEQGRVKADGTSTPKPSKDSERYVRARFRQVLWNEFKQDYLFDLDIEVDSFKKIDIEHTYNIEDIEVDEDLIEEDPYQARIEAKRIGEMQRKITVDDEVKKDYTIPLHV